MKTASLQKVVHIEFLIVDNIQFKYFSKNLKIIQSSVTSILFSCSLKLQIVVTCLVLLLHPLEVPPSNLRIIVLTEVLRRFPHSFCQILRY
jgi:hypothetical protein